MRKKAGNIYGRNNPEKGRAGKRNIKKYGPS